MAPDFCLLKLLIILLLISGGVGELRAKGSPSGVIEVKSGKSVGMNPLPSSDPLSLWCSAVDLHKNGTKTALKLKSAVFKSSIQSYFPRLTGNNMTANLTLADVPVTEAGRWSCELETEQGNITGFIDVYLRPIVFSRHSIRADHRDTSQFHFDGSGITSLFGQEAVLTCPVLGQPTPKVQWRASGEKAILKTGGHYVINGTTLVIKNVTYEHEKTYICIATNSYSLDHKKPQEYDLFLERKLRVKSPIAWVVPLVIILATFLLLVVVIALCECRKRQKEEKRQLTAPAEDDE